MFQSQKKNSQSQPERLHRNASITPPRTEASNRGNDLLHLQTITACDRSPATFKDQKAGAKIIMQERPTAYALSKLRKSCPHWARTVDGIRRKEFHAQLVEVMRGQSTLSVIETAPLAVIGVIQDSQAHWKVVNAMRDSAQLCKRVARHAKNFSAA